MSVRLRAYLTVSDRTEAQKLADALLRRYLGSSIACFDAAVEGLVGGMPHGNDARSIICGNSSSL